MRAGALLLTAAALLVSGRLTASALLTFAGTVALLTFTRQAVSWRRTVWVLPVIAGSAIAGFHGAAVVFGGWPRFVIAMGIAGLIGWLTLLGDRVIAQRVPGVRGTLAFPAVRVPVEYALSLGGPFGTWGSLAALFGGWPGVGAIASVGGVPLVSAWVSWVASLTTALLLAPSSRERRRYALIAAGAVALVMGAGWARQSLAPTADTVRVAMVTLPEDPFRGIASLRNGTVVSSSMPSSSSLAPAVARATDSLFVLSARAADAGARVIVWAEENAAVLAGDEPTLLARAQSFARDHGVYLAVAYAAVDPARERPVDNRLALLTPSGTVGWSYRKRHPVADETRTMLIGDGSVPVLDTPYGRIAGVICYDTDFPGDIRRALGNRADLLLAPSNDWAGITTVRAINTRYRAMELGVTLVRPTSHGVSEAVDAQGRLLAERPYGEGDAVLLADVPSRGVSTWYARLGDVTPAILMALLVLLVGQARRRDR